MLCAHRCWCRTNRESKVHEVKDRIQLTVQSIGVKNIFMTHMKAEGASSMARDSQPLEEVTETFSIAPSVDSKTTNARIHRAKLNEGVAITQSPELDGSGQGKGKECKEDCLPHCPCSG